MEKLQHGKLMRAAVCFICSVFEAEDALGSIYVAKHTASYPIKQDDLLTENTGVAEQMHKISLYTV